MPGCMAVPRWGCTTWLTGPDVLAQQLDQDIMKKVRTVADETGAVIEVSSDPACLEGADVIYTDIWASMGEEDQIEERVKLLVALQGDHGNAGTDRKSGRYLPPLPAVLP